MENKEFNMNQIRPVLFELIQGEKSIIDMISCFKNYKQFLKDIKSEINQTTIIKDVLRVKIDKNLNHVMSNINTIINKENLIIKSGSKKETIFERLNRGLMYKYKIDNSTIAENPKFLTTEIFTIIPHRKYIRINNDDYFLQDSSQFFTNKTYFFNPAESNKDTMSDHSDTTSDNSDIDININVDINTYTDTNMNIQSIMKQIDIEINTINIITEELKLFLIQIETYITTIKNDVKYLNLFNIENLFE
jgi:uncharacterized protein (DUF1697 family)